MRLERRFWPASSPGSGLEILAVHGAWHAAWCFEALALELAARGHGVHAVSLPGHGGSPRTHRWMNAHALGEYIAAVEQVATTFERPPLLVGHSIGGGVAMKVLERRAFPGAVLLGTVPHHGLGPMVGRYLRARPFPTIAALLGFPSALIRNRDAARRMFLSDGNTIDFDSIHARLDKESYRALFALMLPWTLSPMRIRSPMLVIAAEHDRLFTIEEQRTTASRFPDADLEIIAGAGHDVLFEPSLPAIADVIDRWIGEKRLRAR